MDKGQQSLMNLRMRANRNRDTQSFNGRLPDLSNFCGCSGFRIILIYWIKTDLATEKKLPRV